MPGHGSITAGHLQFAWQVSRARILCAAEDVCWALSRHFHTQLPHLHRSAWTSGRALQPTLRCAPFLAVRCALPAVPNLFPLVLAARHTRHTTQPQNAVLDLVYTASGMLTGGMQGDDHDSVLDRIYWWTPRPLFARIILHLSVAEMMASRMPLPFMDVT